MPALKILVNEGVRMSRGKYAAQAVHAALIAAGVHHGDSVIVLGGSVEEIGKCAIQVHDAGRTEVERGTLTAGVAETPFAAEFLPSKSPTELPWEELGVSVDKPDHDGDVPVDLGDGRTYLKPDEARNLARALWAAASLVRAS